MYVLVEVLQRRIINLL